MGKRTLTSSKPHPFWLKATIILFGLCMSVVILSFGKFILAPLAFAAIISMLLNPVVVKFEAWKMGRISSIVLVLLIITVILSGILTLITYRAIEFTDRLPETTEKLKSTLSEAAVTVENIFGISQERQTDYVKNAVKNLFEAGSEFQSSMAEAATGTITFLVLLPIFIFFMLYYKEMYTTFIQKVFERSQNSEIDNVILRVQKVTQNYLVGLFTVMGIMGVLNSIGLLIVGLDYAIPFAIFASLVAIIPVVGAITGALPAIIYAFLFYNTLLMPLMVTAVFTTVQLIESSYLTPKIIGSKVSINPFIAIVVLFLGANVWGIAGMIISIPLIGIMRVGFSQVKVLKPYGYLLGSIVDYDEYKQSDMEEKKEAEKAKQKKEEERKKENG